MLPNNWRYLRGDIYYADMEPHIGSEQGGKRPVVVLQNNIGNRHSPTLIVATVTTRTEKKKNQPTHVLVVHYPKTKEGWDELGKRVATAHANYVIEKIDRLNCPTWQKLELLQAVIDTTKGTYKPKEHQKPGWQPSR